MAAGKWDKRRLAYEVKGRREGTYVLMYYVAEAAASKELDRVFRIADDIIRHLITRVETEHIDTARIDQVAAQAITDARAAEAAAAQQAAAPAVEAEPAAEAVPEAPVAEEVAEQAAVEEAPAEEAPAAPESSEEAPEAEAKAEGE